MKYYECAPEIILRTPMNSYLNLINCSLSIENIWDHFKEDVIFKESVFISSPTLYHEFFENFSKKNKEDQKKIALAIFRYYIRSCTRPTPFGTFSGLSIVELADKTEIKRKNLEERRSKIYLDFGFSIALCKNLLSEIEIRKQSRYIKNSSLTILDDKIFFIERNNMSFEKSQIANNLYLEIVLQHATNYLTYEKLTQVVLLANKDFELEQVHDFIDTLIENQVLVPELEPSLEETNYLSRLIDLLEVTKLNHPSAQKKLMLLREIQVLFQEYESSTTKQIDKLKLLLTINQVFDKLEIPNQRNYFQVDTAYPLTSASLDKEVIKDIRQVINLFYKINNHKKSSHHIYEDFKRKFKKRYDRKVVPLLEALDTDLGIGFRAFDGYDESYPLLDNLKLSNLTKDNHLEVIWSEFDSYLFKEYIKVIESQSYELVLKDEDLINFENVIPNPTDSFFAILYSLNPKQDYKYYFQFFGLNSPNRILGRLSALDAHAQLLSKNIDDNGKRFNKAYVVAEINHLPSDPTMGNVLRKQSTFDYEITYLTKQNNKIQIDPSDLYVSIQNDTILLSSKSLNCYIMPKLSSAHSFGVNTTQLYHFLAGLDDQHNTTSLHFKWGTYKNNYKFHPRVVYKNYIIKLAYWFLKKEDIELVKRMDLDEIAAWRKANRIPRYVRLSESDRHLFIDLENELFLILLIDEIKNKQLVTIEEFLFDNATEAVQTANNEPLANELIFSFLNKKDFRPLDYNLPTYFENTNYFPGDKWLFVKLFVGLQFSDQILCQLIQPLVEKFKSQGRIKRCFFIRYQEDTDTHLRLRFELSELNDNLLLDINNQAKEFIQKKLIWKISVDTYYPEIERYGGPQLMEISESIFDLETELILQTFDPDDSDQERFLFVVKVLDIYSKAFQLNELQKITLFTQMKEVFDLEFKLTKESKKVLSKKHVELLPALVKLLINKEISLGPPEAWRNFEEKLEKLAVEVSELIDPDALNFHLRNHFHMFINRVFPSKQREFELLIANILFRYYKSEKHLLNQYEK